MVLPSPSLRSVIVIADCCWERELYPEKVEAMHKITASALVRAKLLSEESGT